MTKLVQIKEQLLENTYLRCVEKDTIIQYLNDGCEVIFNVRRGRKEEERCLKLSRRGEYTCYRFLFRWFRLGERR